MSASAILYFPSFEVTTFAVVGFQNLKNFGTQELLMSHALTFAFGPRHSAILCELFGNPLRALFSKTEICFFTGALRCFLGFLTSGPKTLRGQLYNVGQLTVFEKAVFVHAELFLLIAGKITFLLKNAVLNHSKIL